MEFIEMIAWICFGFAPTLGIGNFIWSRYDKRKADKKIISELTRGE
jgi:hypothetical protein